MSKDSQQVITHVLQQDSSLLQGILDKLKHFKDLHTILAQYLDTKLAAHCQVVNMENGHLVIITDSALWATQFRFQIPALLPKLQKHEPLSSLKNISCKISPSSKTQIPEAPHTAMMPRLSLQTAEMILTAAKTINHDKLKLILQKIAKNIN
jgi:hypothetical protein